MTHRSSKVELLDKTISALEDFVLSASDNEILAQSPKDGHAANDMRRLIERNIAKSGIRLPSLASNPDRLPSKTKRISRTATDTSTNLMSRLALLKSLMTTHPELAPRFGAVFSSRKALTNEELDDLTKELIQMGLLPKNGSKTE